MSLKRYSTKRDTTEPQIVAALRKAGAQVILMDQPVDLLVLYRGQIYLLDAKTPRGKKAAIRRTFKQKLLEVKGWPIGYSCTPEDALKAIGALR